jgi:hypothetical protein
VEVSTLGGTLKGSYRIGSIGSDGKTVTLVTEPEGGSVSIDAGDLWQGVYRFDNVMVRGGAKLTSVDPIRAPGHSLNAPATGLATSWNEHAPMVNPTKVTISIGAVAGSYRIDLAPDAVSDPEGVAEIRVSDGISVLVEPVKPGTGTTIYWPGHAGQTLALTAIDAHPVLQLGAVVELPPLPDGGWTIGQGSARQDDRPRLLLAGEHWISMVDETVSIIDHKTGDLLGTAPPRDGAGPIIGVVRGGSYLVVARARAVQLLDLTAPVDGAWTAELPADAAVVGVASDESEAIFLVRTTTIGGSPELNLYAVPLTSQSSGPAWSEPSLFSIPEERPVDYRLVIVPGWVHAVGASATTGVPAAIYSFRNDFTGRAITETPLESNLDGGWSLGGAWESGIILLFGSQVRLLQFEDGRWHEGARLVLDGTILAASGDGQRIALVLPGEARVYDVSDPSTPRLVASIPGCSQRDVTLHEGLLLWSSGFAAVPAELPWLTRGGALNASGGPPDGFTPVVDGAGNPLR